VSAPIVRIEDVTKRFREVVAVDRVSLAIRPNEFFALLGPSGCGKTTLLRMLAGFEPLSAGRIVIDGEDMAGVVPNRRPVNMVFQSYAVFPHMTVAENVAYGLKVSRVPRPQIGPRVAGALAMVRLEGFEGRRPEQLSGGQRQRVAIARALMLEPEVLLLDEPTSSLDVSVQAEILNLLVQLRLARGLTYLFVSHNLAVIGHMCSQVAIMKAGAIVEQVPTAALRSGALADPYSRQLLKSSEGYDRATAAALVSYD